MVTGSDAEVWLDTVLACRIPRPGRMTLAPMLKHDGKVIGDFSLARLDEETFLIIGSGVAENYHMRWFIDHLDDDMDVDIAPMGLGLSGLSIAGPNARDVLAKITHEDVSNEGLAFMDVQEMELGMAPVILGRVSFTGDLATKSGWRRNISAMSLI